MRSTVKNRVHAILAKHLHPARALRPVRQGGREFFVSLQLRDAPRRRLESLIALICDFDREIKQTPKEIEQRANADDRVDVRSAASGRYTAMLIIAVSRRLGALSGRRPSSSFR